MSSIWTITNPAGAGTVTLASLNLSNPQIEFRVMGVSMARMRATRELSSADAWWAFDTQITIYRDSIPFFTGRVQENPDAADGRSSSRTLVLADAWQDIEDTIYRESWAVGDGTHMYPKAILGMNDEGEAITTGEQIAEVIDFLITRGVGIAKGDIADGVALWPSEVRNVSCDSIITGEMRFHPDWVAWLDHSTLPPTFHARPKDELTQVTIDTEEDNLESRSWAEVKRNKPLGVDITYESANIIDDNTYRASYQDTAGVTTGRRVMTAMLDLEGMNIPFQKSRISTRTLPTNAVNMVDWFKAKYPELADIPDVNFLFKKFQKYIVPDFALPDAINPRAARLAVSGAGDVPRELVAGTIEDWMRVKVRRVVMTYDLIIAEAGRTAAQKKLIRNFNGEGKSVSVNATNAFTKIYKGVSHFTAGEDRPEGIAAAIFAAASEQQFEGYVTMVHDEIPAGRWHGKLLIVKKGLATLMPGSVITSATVNAQTKRVSVNFGAMPHLSAGDFLELQRIFNRRKVTWMSPQERISNELGSESRAGSQGESVGGFDTPTTITPPGGGGGRIPHYWPQLIVTPGAGLSPATYAVEVTPGWVREIKTGSGDALAYHKALNHYKEAEPATDPVTYTNILEGHGIAVEQCVYIVVQIDANGRVATGESEEDSNPVEIEIADDEEESIQYIPKVDTDTPNGMAGTLRVKLAKLLAPSAAGDDPDLEMFMAGDHIDWIPPLPAFRTAWSAGEGVGVVFRDWNNSGNCYRVRAITQKDPVEAIIEPPAPAQEAQVRITQHPDRIVVQGNSKIRKVKYRIGDGSLLPVVSFDDGLETEGVAKGNELILNMPEVKDKGAAAQVRIRQIGFEGVVSEIGGNDINQTLSYQIGTGSPVDFATFEDGLFTEGQNIVIPLPGGGTGSLPDGVYVGDMLYWNGAGWDIVSHPGDNESNSTWVLHANSDAGGGGGGPGWQSYEKITVSICVSGTPTEYTILGIPTPLPP